MKSLRFLDRQVGSGLLAFALLLTLVLPGLVPAFASAAQVTERSIALSDSAASATDVEYTVKFTAIEAAGAFVLQFCNDSPVIGQTCTAPTGFDVTGLTTSTPSTTVAEFEVSDSSALVTTAITADEDVEVVLEGIENPSEITDDDTGFYARILTYTDATVAAAQFTSATSVGSFIDEGGVAMSITNAIGVTAAVRETMTFCVASATITANCANASANAPSFELGEGSGNSRALSPSAVSTGTVHTQLSTNAVGGAVVNLKNSRTACGGLWRVGASSNGCGIAPAISGGIANGEAKFGVRTASATATSGVTDATGTLAPVDASGYNDSTYFMGYDSGDATGVTSTYGDPFLDSDGAPINNQNMQLTFGASASNNTPAGTYQATLSMIASGTF